MIEQRSPSMLSAVLVALRVPWISKVPPPMSTRAPASPAADQQLLIAAVLLWR
jgi:hypothetical protein